MVKNHLSYEYVWRCNADLCADAWCMVLWSMVYHASTPPRRSELEIKKSHAFLGLSPMSVTATFR